MFKEFACSSVDNTTKVSGEALNLFSFQKKIPGLVFCWELIKEEIILTIVKAEK